MGITLKDLFGYIQFLAKQNAQVAKKNNDILDDKNRWANQRDEKDELIKKNYALLSKTAELGRFHNTIFQFINDNLQEIIAFMKEENNAKLEGPEKSIEIEKNITIKDESKEVHKKGNEPQNQQTQPVRKVKEKVVVVFSPKGKVFNLKKETEKKLQQLNEKLKECIEKEEYEACQKIHNQIKLLETEAKRNE